MYGSVSMIMSEGTDDKHADGGVMPGDGVLGKTSIRKALERLSGTQLWKRCSKRTLRRLERFLGSEAVPEGVDADAFAFYTAQGYLNGAVASMFAHYEGDRSDVLERKRAKYIDVTSSPVELVESIRGAIGSQKPMVDGFERGFSDGVRTMDGYHVSDDVTARLLTISLVSAVLGVTGESKELGLYLDGGVESILEDASCAAYRKDCVLFVSECIDDEGGSVPMIQGIVRHFGDGTSIAAHIGVPTTVLRDAIIRAIPYQRAYIEERVSPTMGVCSDTYTLPTEYATVHAYGMMSALLRPADEDDDAPLVSDVICDASQDEMAAFVIRASDGAIGGDAVYDALADLAAALSRVGMSLESPDDDNGRGMLGGIVAARMMPCAE